MFSSVQLKLNDLFPIQSDLVITTNDTTEYSTSDQNVMGTDLFLSKLLPYNGNHAYRHRRSFLGTNLNFECNFLSLERQKILADNLFS